LELSVHESDVFRYLLGDVEEVFGATKLFEKVKYTRDRKIKAEPDVDDTFFSILKFKSGALGQWSVSEAGHGPLWPPFWSGLRIYGSKGLIDQREGLILDVLTDITDDELIRMPPEERIRKTEKRISSREIVENYYKSLDERTKARFFPWGMERGGGGEEWMLYDFYNAITKEEKPELDALEGLKAAALSYAVVESSYINRPVRVKDVEDGVVDGYQREIDEKLGLT